MVTYLISPDSVFFEELHVQFRQNDIACRETQPQSFSSCTTDPMITSSSGKLLALLALREWNPTVTGGFSSQRPVTRSCDVFFDLRIKQRLSKRWKRRWFETPSRSLWRQCNAILFAEEHNTKHLIVPHRPYYISFIRSHVTYNSGTISKRWQTNTKCAGKNRSSDKSKN